MTVPNVRGLVVGRALLYPPDGDVAGAIARAARIVRPGACRWLSRPAPARRHAGRRDATPWRSRRKQAGWAYSGPAGAPPGRGRAAGPSTPATGRGGRAARCRPPAWRWRPTGSASSSTAGRASSLGSRDFAYVGRDTALTLAAGGAGGEVALPSARCDARSGRARYGPAEEVPVEVRGAGPATRQVTNFMSPDVLARRRARSCASSCSRPTATGRRTRPTSTTTRRSARSKTRRSTTSASAGPARTLLARRLRAAPALHRRRPDRRDGRGPRRRRVPHPPRLPRALRRRARLHDVLPERAGRVRSRALDGLLRRPRPPLGARLVGGDGHRPSLPDDERRRTSFGG